ncbi:hypothetical protein EB796_022373 [Bugula neritina]|uniref:WSC domain-containing protein n=1 Tax=Bugula neritina TaxID=10212 RepID=A0A7J7IZJ2_BUGNE|nr:hypothetical protein EB796_022373 [Bugula neritina]
MAEAQPARNIPTGQTPLREHLYQPLSTERLQFSFQQKYASPSAYYTSYTQPLPEYVPQTQPPPEYASHTQPLPEYASCTQQSPEYVPHTQPPPGYAPHTQPPPDYASCTQQPPENAPHTQQQPENSQQGNSAQPPAFEFFTDWPMGVQDSQPQPALKDTSSTCWLVVGILTAMLCCLPLGVTGALKACEAADQAKSDDDAEYKRKICLSKASSLIGIGLGLLLITSITAKSDNKPRDLDGDEYNFGDDLSVGNCTNYCSERGYKYAGLQNGFFCSCGTSYGSYGELDQDECSSVCSADGLECGGLYSNSVYRTNYIGCYKDYNEIFDYHIDLPDDEVTPSSCTKHCKTDGYRFAGLWSGRYCYCGDHFNRFDKAPDEECNWGCPDNSELSCGGSS